ncbi:MAG: hypothetical protein ACLFRT_14725 [Actinomycetota bacterium]
MYDVDETLRSLATPARLDPQQMEANRLDESAFDDADIYVTTPGRITELLVEWKNIDITTFIIETAAPFDDETAERIATDIRSDLAAA